MSELTDAEVAAAADALVEVATWIRPHGRVAGFSATALSVLARLDRAPARVGELAVTEAATQPALTALINRLEGEALVSRAPDPTDGRASIVSLTESGVALIATLRERRHARVRAAVDSLPAEQRTALLGALPALASLARAEIRSEEVPA